MPWICSVNSTAIHFRLSDKSNINDYDKIHYSIADVFFADDGLGDGVYSGVDAL